MVFLASAEVRRMYRSAVLGVIGQLVPPESFLEFHMLWDRRGGLAIACEQSISIVAASCPFQEYVDSRVVAGGGCNIVRIKGVSPSISCLEISAGQGMIPA